MDFVDITLAGQVYKMRYTADDILDICSRLTTFQPVGGGKVTPTIVGNMLLQTDPQTIQYCMWAGLRHINQFKNIDPPDAQKIIGKHIARGGQYKDFRIGIFKCFVGCGFADFSPIVKILEEEEARLAEDSAIDVDPTAAADAEEDRETDRRPRRPPRRGI